MKTLTFQHTVIYILVIRVTIAYLLLCIGVKQKLCKNDEKDYCLKYIVAADDNQVYDEVVF